MNNWSDKRGIYFLSLEIWIRLFNMHLMIYINTMSGLYLRKWFYWSRDKRLPVLFRSIVPFPPSTIWKQNEWGTCSRIQCFIIISHQFNLGESYSLHCHWSFFPMNIMLISMWFQHNNTLPKFHYHHPTDKCSISQSSRISLFTFTLW